MEKREINPLLKQSLELGPVLLFFVAFFLLKGKSLTIAGETYETFIIVTAIFVPVLLASIGLLWWLTGKISRMQVLTAVLVIVFGGLSIWFNDERFFKMKPTVIYLIFSGVLGFGLMRGQSYLEYVMEGLLPLEPQGWLLLTKRFALFFLGLAIANELIWRNGSTELWVSFKTFGLPILLFAFFAAQYKLIERFGTDGSRD